MQRNQINEWSKLLRAQLLLSQIYSRDLGYVDPVDFVLATYMLLR